MFKKGAQNFFTRTIYPEHLKVLLRNSKPGKPSQEPSIEKMDDNRDIMHPTDYSGKNHAIVANLSRQTIDKNNVPYIGCEGTFTTKPNVKGKETTLLSDKGVLNNKPMNQYVNVFDKFKWIRQDAVITHTNATTNIEQPEVMGKLLQMNLPSKDSSLVPSIWQPRETSLTIVKPKETNLVIIPTDDI